MLTALPLHDYRAAIALDEPFRPLSPPAPADRLGVLTGLALRLLGADPWVSGGALPRGLGRGAGVGEGPEVGWLASPRRLGFTEDPQTERLASPRDHGLGLGLGEGPEVGRFASPRDHDQQLGRFPLPRRLTSPRGLADQRRLLRAALTTREPAPFDPDLLAVLDAVLGGERRQAELVDARSLPAPIAVWRGDITRLTADAIVNAANDTLLGCFQPMHPCVDNAVHAAAGPRLRADCHRIMAAQAAPEPTGIAKITRGYHLPASFVLHTVGPIVRGKVLPAHETALADSYRACLGLAAEVPSIRTIAFCAVSTGIFGFPKAAAARIAVGTVRDWLATRPGRFDRVVFTTFGDEDDDAYRELL